MRFLSFILFLSFSFYFAFTIGVVNGQNQALTWSSKDVQNFEKILPSNNALKVDPKYVLEYKQDSKLRMDLDLESKISKPWDLKQNEEIIENFFANCSTPSRTCWGSHYHPNSIENPTKCVESKDCIFAISVEEFENHFQVSFFRKIVADFGNPYISFGNEMFRLLLTYLPLKGSENSIIEDLDCTKEPNLNDLKTFVYSRESPYTHSIVTPVVESQDISKSTLKENCLKSLEPIEDQKIYSVKSYMKYWSMYTVEAFSDSENLETDYESGIYKTEDEIFYWSKNEARFFDGEIFDPFYDKCSYPAQKVCKGVFAEFCDSEKNCYYGAAIRETSDAFQIRIMYHSASFPHSLYLAVSLQTLKNLGETSIVECREPTLNDFKLFIYTNLTEFSDDFISRGLGSTWVSKKKFISSCQSKNHTEIQNPIPLKYHYWENFRLAAFSSDFDNDENIDKLEEMESKDGFFYTNFKSVSEEPSSTTPQVPESTTEDSNPKSTTGNSIKTFANLSLISTILCTLTLI